MNIGQRIRERREYLGLTQEELATKLGYKSRSSVNKVENSREVSMKKIKAYAEALETTVSFLMGWETKEESDLRAYNNFVKNWYMRTYESLGYDYYKIIKSFSVLPSESKQTILDTFDFLLARNNKSHLIESEEELDAILANTTETPIDELDGVDEFNAYVSSLPLPLESHLNAAHADDYASAPEELKKQEEDIMDDEDF